MFEPFGGFSIFNTLTLLLTIGFFLTFIPLVFYLITAFNLVCNNLVVVVAPQPAARTSFPPQRPPPPSAEDLNNNSSELQAQKVIEKQQKLHAKQLAEAEHDRLVRASKNKERDSGRKKVHDLLAKEKLALETLGLEKIPAVDEPLPPRRKWGLPPEMRLDSPPLLPAGTITWKSVASEASEYLSLSEEENSATPPSVPRRRMRNAVGPKLDEPPTPFSSVDGDADSTFRAMCSALAARQKQSLMELSGSSTLPSDLSQVPIETLQSMDHSDNEETDDEDRRPNNGAEFWRRSSSEPVGGGISLSLHTAISARRSSSFDTGHSSPPLLNSASNTNHYLHL